MDFYLSIVLFFLFLAFLLYFIGGKRPDKYPPGPRGIPGLGNAGQLGQKGYIVALKWKEKYGDIIGLQFGFRWAVILNNPDDVREAFNRPEFSGRGGYNFFLDSDVEDVNLGVIMSQGKVWTDNRRFTLRTLRDFGFGKRSMENIIMEEVRELVEHMKPMTGTAVSTARTFNLAVFNVIWSIVAGQRYSFDDEELSMLVGLLLKFMGSVFKGGRFLLLIYPSLSKYKSIFPFLDPKDGKAFREELFSFIRKAIKEHRETREEGNPRDFIDAYLDEMSKAGESGTHAFENDDLGFAVLLMDLFVAGAETTSTSLCWSFFLLGLHPQCQQKLFEELDSVVGQKEVLLEDRARLPYVEATIMEIMRVSTLTPFGVPHAVNQDVTFKGYFFPKGTTVLSNVHAAHFDPDLWEEPEKFMPERFLSDDLKTVKKNKNLMPFGVGKRSCMGESLARDELFLFLTNLVKNFEISMPPNEPPHSLEGVRGGVNTPEPHNVLLSVRAK